MLEDGYIEPLGSNERRHVDVRVVAATNRDLREEIRAGRFREDLYYRLNSAEIALAPLRARRSEIPRLAIYILDRFNSTLKKPRRLSTDALAKLQSYSWLGNVRDLRAVIQRAVMFSRGKDLLDAEDVVLATSPDTDDQSAHLPEPQYGFRMDEYLSRVRDALIRKALNSAKDNQSEAARMLGVSSQAVSNFVNRAREKNS